MQLQMMIDSGWQHKNTGVKYVHLKHTDVPFGHLFTIWDPLPPLCSLVSTSMWGRSLEIHKKEDEENAN